MQGLGLKRRLGSVCREKVHVGVVINACRSGNIIINKCSAAGSVVVGSRNTTPRSDMYAWLL